MFMRVLLNDVCRTVAILLGNCSGETRYRMEGVSRSITGEMDRCMMQEERQSLGNRNGGCFERLFPSIASVPSVSPGRSGCLRWPGERVWIAKLIREWV